MTQNPLGCSEMTEYAENIIFRTYLINYQSVLEYYARQYLNLIYLLIAFDTVLDFFEMCRIVLMFGEIRSSNKLKKFHKAEKSNKNYLWSKRS